MEGTWYVNNALEPLLVLQQTITNLHSILIISPLHNLSQKHKQVQSSRIQPQLRLLRLPTQHLLLSRRRSLHRSPTTQRRTPHFPHWQYRCRSTASRCRIQYASIITRWISASAEWSERSVESRVRITVGGVQSVFDA
jgi:hypothetical protein